MYNLKLYYYFTHIHHRLELYTFPTKLLPSKWTITRQKVRQLCEIKCIFNRFFKTIKCPLGYLLHGLSKSKYCSFSLKIQPNFMHTNLNINLNQNEKWTNMRLPHPSHINSVVLGKNKSVWLWICCFRRWLYSFIINVYYCYCSKLLIYVKFTHTQNI